MAHCGRCATPPPVPQPGRVAFQGSRGALGPVWATEQGLTGVVRPSGTKVRALKGFDDALRQVRGSPSQLGGGGGGAGGGGHACQPQWVERCPGRGGVGGGPVRRAGAVLGRAFPTGPSGRCTVHGFTCMGLEGLAGGLLKGGRFAASGTTLAGRQAGRQNLVVCKGCQHAGPTLKPGIGFGTRLGAEPSRLVAHSGPPQHLCLSPRTPLASRAYTHCMSPTPFCQAARGGDPLPEDARTRLEAVVAALDALLATGVNSQRQARLHLLRVW